MNFKIWLVIPETLTFLIGLTFLIRFQNLTCYFWDFELFIDLTFLIKSILTISGPWRPLKFKQRPFLTLVVTVWLWFFKNALCHTRKQSHHRLSQHRLRNIDLIRGCSPSIRPTVPFGQLELYIPPPRFWS